MHLKMLFISFYYCQTLYFLFLTGALQQRIPAQRRTMLGTAHPRKRSSFEGRDRRTYCRIGIKCILCAQKSHKAIPASSSCLNVIVQQLAFEHGVQIVELRVKIEDLFARHDNYLQGKTIRYGRRLSQEICDDCGGRGACWLSVTCFFHDV